MKYASNNHKLFTGNTLKILAVITMLIDHIGAVIIEKGTLPFIHNSLLSGNNTDYVTDDLFTMSTLDLCFRIIGRIAFPIFLFLLVEGFMHTRDPLKYAVRLFIFAIISEVPFDMAINDHIFELGSQNVFFTLTLAIIMYMVFELTKERFDKRVIVIALEALIFVVTAIGAYILRCDYNIIGITFALFMYLFRGNMKQLVISFTAVICTFSILDANFLAEVPALLAFIPIAFYNGERGTFKLKYFFYAFYPLHLLILTAIRFGIYGV